MNTQTQNYTKAFNLAQSASQAPAWLKDLQKNSLRHFSEIGFPIAKNEEWKYTSTKSLAELNVQLPVFDLNNELPDEVLDYIQKFSERLVFINGHLALAYSTLNSNKNLTLNTLQQAESKSVKDYLQSSEDADSFTSLNKAFNQDITLIQIKAKTKIEKPLHIIHIAKASANETGTPLMAPRTCIILEDFSEATLLESFISFDNHSYFTNAVTDITVGVGAKLNMCKIQAESLQAKHMATTRISQAQDSQVFHFDLSLGAKLSRNDLTAAIKDQNSHVALNGLYAVKESQHIDNHTNIDHQKPNSTSSQLYKGILDDKARAVFNGKVYIRKDAQKTSSDQLNKNLMLSEKARVDTKPQLEIAADDVTCTHGATVGQINDEELFYFESRCIPKNMARHMLTHGFVNDVIDKIQNQAIKEAVQELVSKRYFS